MAINRLSPRAFKRPSTPGLDSGARDSIVETLRPAVQRAGKMVERTIDNHPVACLAAGLAIGVVLGCLIKRR